MLDIIIRSCVAGCILIGTAYLPASGSASAASLDARKAGASKPMRSCPPQWGGVVRTCIA